MFGSNKVPKSLVDAVSQIMQVDEAAEKVPTPTGMRVYGSSYGNSAKARRDQTKSSVDTLKGPKAKEMKEEEDIENLDELMAPHKSGYTPPPKPKTEEDNCVTKPQAKTIAKGEVKKHEKKMHEEEDDKGVMSFKDRLIERSMTSAETKKKEKMVLSMKDKQSYFKKKYGKRWKEVMYATATKKAMSEEMVAEEEIVDEASKAEISAAHDAFVTQTMNLMRKQKAKMDKIDGRKTINTAGPSGTPEQQAKRHGKMARDIYNKSKNEEVEVEESFADEHGIGRDIADKKQKMATASNTGKGKPLHNVAKGLKAFLQGRKEPMESVNVEGEVLDEKASIDMLKGRVYQDKPEHNAHKPSKIDLSDAGEELPKGKIQQAMSTRARSSIDTHEGLPTKVDNLDPRYGKPDAFVIHTEAKDPETSDAWGGQANFVTNGNTSSDEPKKKEASEVSVDEKVIAGTPGWEKVKGADTKGNVKDKSGAVHTPMSRAKDLARQAFKKVQKETLGIAPNNQTGV